MSHLAVLIDKGFELASGFLSYLREKDERQSQLQTVALEQQEVFNSRLLNAMEDVSRNLSIIAGDTAFRVSKKLESDRLEDLAAQVKSLKLAIELDNQSMLGSSLASISVQIEYAKNRLAEGKMEWLGAWMMAESIRLAGLNKIANGSNAIALVHKEAQHFRINILEFTRELIIKPNQTPWVEIAQFIEGKNETVLALLKREQIADSVNTQTILREILVPDIGGHTNVDVIEVHVGQGKMVQPNDPIATIETDKATMEISADKAGLVIEVKIKVGDKVSEGDVLVALS